jgi:cation diffusion facilitator CzcD-associated flavoprotein CzcO/acetyl esterase/lipase
MPEQADRHQIIIVGSGFAGLGMAIALRKAGFNDVLMLEKARDVGGVWRDNSYPGAACDVPSHLYSFSFEPNPNWSHAFAPQSEIHDYLKNCADKYDLLRQIRFGVEVAHAQYQAQNQLWQITLTNGRQLQAHFFITASGQLSRPALPDIPGIEQFKGKCFHSARWDHQYDLTGKTVAVIGTGASAIQFVPAIAQKVKQLKVFQRTPNHMLPRKDRAYSRIELSLFKRFPWIMKLYRLQIYANFESRALAFTRFGWLMKPMVGFPFHRMLKEQVPDAAMREKLEPDYAIGCKRILLTNDYLATMAMPNVELITDSITRITSDSVEVEGTQHKVDAIIYGTGFAATEFLAPMRIQGRDGLELNHAWQRGAEAYLGITVPQFPNFFMLYGPNTNLGHNSIVYMLESQIAHVTRCLRFMRDNNVQAMEVDASIHRRFNQNVQRKLKLTVWNGCKSWYVDKQGHNSINWPGFTLSYRWLTQFKALDAYRFTQGDDENTKADSTLAEPGMVEAANASLQRALLRIAFRPWIGPPFSAGFQRIVVNALSLLMPTHRAVLRYKEQQGALSWETVAAKGNGCHGAILYLHGGAFCLGSPFTHRTLTSRLALESGMDIWVPNYRLAPEHPYPAALEDALTTYNIMLQRGYRGEDIVIAGDSAGGALALALALRLRDEGLSTMPAALMLLSPVTDSDLGGTTLSSNANLDPMLRQNWLQQGIDWYNCPQGTPGRDPLTQNLAGLPPILIQAGDEEILLSDATRLAEKARADGVEVELEVYAKRWHVFQLQAAYLRSARKAIAALGQFARRYTYSLHRPTTNPVPPSTPPHHRPPQSDPAPAHPPDRGPTANAE